MGVPSYFRWLVARYESTILVKKLPKSKTRYLLLDFNGAIHPAIRTDSGLKREDMPTAVIKYLETILSWVNPDKVFIAIDGVAPRAKMEQQRERRYKSVMDARFYRELNKRYGMPVSEEQTDFNMISPGTEFMAVLHEKIQKWISEQPSPLMFKLSGADVPGEGEHKIMHEIRSAKETDDGTVYCVYGLDADLIFLSALTNPDIFLVREATQFDSKTSAEDYRLLSIRALYNRLIAVLDSSTSLDAIASEGIANNVAVPVQPVPMPEDHVRRMTDYTVLCFFVGNDFLPHLPSVKIREESLSDLIVLYKVISWELKDYLVYPSGNINREFLYQLFASLADMEDEVLREQTKARHSRIAKHQYRRKKMSAYEKEKDSYENVESQWYDQIDAGQLGWRDRYYSYYSCTGSIQSMVENYIAGLQWVLNYYTGHTNGNWSWYYRYPVAPSVSDLADLMKNIKECAIQHEKTEPVNPLVQLMHILPPDSVNLIPDRRMRRLMIDKSSPILWYYPSSFKIDFQGARFRHEGRCLLPKGDITEFLNNDIII